MSTPLSIQALLNHLVIIFTILVAYLTSYKRNTTTSFDCTKGGAGQGRMRKIF